MMNQSARMKNQHYIFPRAILRTYFIDNEFSREVKSMDILSKKALKNSSIHLSSRDIIDWDLQAQAAKCFTVMLVILAAF